MKNFKLKLFSLIMCVCICLSFFTGCSLFPKNEDADKSAVALTVGGYEITKEDLINSYYSFRQNNYYFIMYATEEQIMEGFYETVVKREIVLAEVRNLIKDNKIKLTQEEYDKIWNDTFDFIYSEIDTKEKNILLLEDEKEENLPKRLQTKEKESDVYKHEPYVFEPIIKVDYDTVVKGSEKSYDEKLEEFLADIYKYNASTDEDVRDMQPIADSEIAKRTEAYEMYVSDLMLSAKANGKNSNKNVVLEKEIKRVYNSTLEGALYTKYQEYVESLSAGSEDGSIKNEYSVEVIAAKYKELLNASTESNTLQENYISVITSTKNESLILYHYQGEYKYFSVQHILIPFDSETESILADIPGYNADKHAMFRETYEQVRETYVSEEMTTTYRDYETGKYVIKSGTEDEKDTITIKSILQNYNEELANIDGYNAMSAEEQARQRALLFNKYAWIYSGDKGSLTNDTLSNILGFTISAESHEHGTLAKDFANGARELYEDYANGTKEIAEVISPVVSDFGVHLMMLTGVYDSEEIVSTTGKTDPEIVAELEDTYISNMTNQTFYAYVYDMIKESVVGDKGSYFSDHVSDLLVKYDEEGLIDYKLKMSYKELNEAIS